MSSGLLGFVPPWLPSCVPVCGVHADWASSASSVPWSSSALGGAEPFATGETASPWLPSTHSGGGAVGVTHPPGLRPASPAAACWIADANAPVAASAPFVPSGCEPLSGSPPFAAPASSVSAESGVTNARLVGGGLEDPGAGGRKPPTPRLATVTTAMAMPRPARNRVEAGIRASAPSIAVTAAASPARSAGRAGDRKAAINASVL